MKKPTPDQIRKMQAQLQSLLDIQSKLFGSPQPAPIDRRTKHVGAREFAQTLAAYPTASSVEEWMRHDELGTQYLLGVAKRYVESVASGALSISDTKDDGPYSLLLDSVIEFADSGLGPK